MFKWLRQTASDIDPQLLFIAALAGAVAGTLLATLDSHTQLLEDLYIMVHEQKRLTLAAAQRELAAAAKENPTDA